MRHRDTGGRPPRRKTPRAERPVPSPGFPATPANPDITDSLRRLAPEQREALLETYFKKCTVQEAADALGVSAGTVKRHLHQALRALRKSLFEAY